MRITAWNDSHHPRLTWYQKIFLWEDFLILHLEELKETYHNCQLLPMRRLLFAPG